MYSKLRLFQLKKMPSLRQNIIFFKELTEVLEVTNFKFLANMNPYSTHFLLFNLSIVFSYLAVLDPLQAAVCLSRRSDLSALRTAAKICLVANEIEAARLYTRRLVQDCYVACDWLTAQEVVNSHSHFMVSYCEKKCSIFLRLLTAIYYV